jgi:hypothetical protein
MSEAITTNTKPLTFDDILNALQHWRKNKSSYNCTGMPDEIWIMAFKLEEQGNDAAMIRKVCGFNSAQYRKKWKQLNTEVNSAESTNLNTSNEPAKEMQFVQAQICHTDPEDSIPSLDEKATENKRTIKQLKSSNVKIESYLNTETAVVEYYRPDGMLLKIHTANHNLSAVINSFLKCEV